MGEEGEEIENEKKLRQKRREDIWIDYISHTYYQRNKERMRIREVSSHGDDIA